MKEFDIGSSAKNINNMIVSRMFNVKSKLAETEEFQKGVKAGNKVLAKIIKEKQPQIALSGHIHSSNHKLEKKKGFGNTLFATVSLVNENYQPIYEPLYFEI